MSPENSFKGRDSWGREVEVRLGSEKVDITRRTVQRMSGAGNFATIVDEAVKNPGERAEIAQIVGIKV